MKFRKLISFILAIVLSVGIVTMEANAQSITREDKILYLVEKGMPNDYFTEMPDEILNSWYEKIYGKDILYLGEASTTMREVTSEITPYGSIPSSDMTFTVSAVGFVTNLADGRKKLNSVIISAEYLWAEGKPLICYEDAVSVNWDSSLFAYSADSFDSFDYYLDSGSWVLSERSYSPSEINQGGLGYYASLTSGKDQLKGYSMFSVVPCEDNMYTTSANRTTSINAQYVHTKTLGILGGTFGYAGNGIVINAPALSDSTAASDNFSYSIG